MLFSLQFREPLHSGNKAQSQDLIEKHGYASATATSTVRQLQYLTHSTIVLALADINSPARGMMQTLIILH